MNIHDILTALNLGEDKDWEFKSAKGGLPGSLWETYSAMANTDGGAIVLGIKQKDGTFTVQGLDDPQKLLQNFWDCANDRGKVICKLVGNQDVSIEQIADKSVIVVRVPIADHSLRPVYIGPDPIKGTYRRNNEGDYHCTETEVRRMFADRLEVPPDSRILPGYQLDDLHARSLKEYRNRFASRSPGHAWLSEDDEGLLRKLGGWRRDRQTGEDGLTIAGLLMFGRQETICEPQGVPHYQVDYRERLSAEPSVRWTDRITLDGTWSGNLFQFFQRVIRRLTSDLKIPFRLQPDMMRVDDTIIHEAIREALVNALIHADYQGDGGIVIEKHPDHFEFSNPGSLLVSFDQLLEGGTSVCRNKALQKMFLMIGGGEQAGSGIDKIRKGWESQHWRSPRIQKQFQPDRVKLDMPMVSLLPDESVERIRGVLGRQFDQLTNLERQALVTADVEDEVSNSRLREICADHPADVTHMLQGLVAKGLLIQFGKKRGATYRLSEQFGGSVHLKGNSAQIDGNSTQIDGEAPSNSGPAPPQTNPRLLAIAEPARLKRKLPKVRMRELILSLCRDQFLTPRQLGELLDRQPVGLQQNYLREMVQAGDLKLRFPKEPNHPNQAYTTDTEP